jgi:hypothetical protein
MKRLRLLFPAVIFLLFACNVSDTGQSVRIDSPTSPPVEATATTREIQPTEIPPASVAPEDGAICTNSAQYVSSKPDDGTAFQAGDRFTLSWTIANTGTCQWTTAYSFVLVSGDAMGAPGSIPLDGSVSPGQALTLSIAMTAPGEAGTFSTAWMLSDPSGVRFGTGNQADQPVAIRIEVAAAAFSPTPTDTATQGSAAASTITPTITQNPPPETTPKTEVQQDEVDGGDISVGQTVLGSIDDANYADFWYFNGKQGDTVTVFMSAVLGSESLDPYIGLFYDNGQNWDLLAMNEDYWTGESATDAAITAFALPYDGRYAITASRPEGEKGSGGGQYVLALTDPSADSGMLGLVANPTAGLHIRGGIVVAVIDSGVNADPVFGKRLLNGVNVCSGDAADTTDSLGHGTAMAKVIHSIAPNAFLYPIKNDCGGLANALAKARAVGADIVNHSGYHGSETSIATSDDASCWINGEPSSIQQQIDLLFDIGTFIFSSAGNDSKADGVRYPAACQWVIGVAATAGNSNQSQFVDISAEANSTSEAAARLSGITARIMEKFPYYDNSGIVNALLCNARDAGTKGWDNKYGIGLADLNASLKNGSKAGGISGYAGSCIPWDWEKKDYGRNTWSVP